VRILSYAVQAASGAMCTLSCHEMRARHPAFHSRSAFRLLAMNAFASWRLKPSPLSMSSRARSPAETSNVSGNSDVAMVSFSCRLGVLPAPAVRNNAGFDAAIVLAFKINDA
jgi:hypothetical protein